MKDLSDDIESFKEKATWLGPTKHNRGEPVEPPKFSANYMPQLCEFCYGVGWMSKPDPDPSISAALVKCTHCNRANHARLSALWQVSSLDPNKTNPPTVNGFEVTDEYTRNMRNAAKAFILKPQGWLTMHGRGQGRANRGEGGWGAGKTHLGEAITRALLSNGIECLFMTADNLFAYLGAGYMVDKSIDYGGRIQRVKDIAVLVIDELNKESSTAESLERIRLDVLQHRYRMATNGHGGATVLLSNDAPDYWSDTAIADRACDTRFVRVEVTPVSYRRVGR